MDDYMSRFRLKDQKWREWVDDGTKTMQEYNEWRYGQIAVGQRWEAMKDTIAHDVHNTNMIAKSITQGYMPEVYANNFNYGTYEAEVGSHIDTSFTLYDRQTVERIMRDDPDLLPAPGKKTSKRIAEGKDVLWNKKQIQSVMTQGILQGESIPKLSKRLATTVGDKNYKAAIRNARTMTTGAQNAGRMDSYKRAESMGIDMEVEWIATLDGRTRHEHRMLDGQMRPVGQPFEVEGIKIQYAGDPHAPGNMIYNCRCTLAGHVKGFDAAEVDRDTSAIGDMTYDEWKKSKDIKSNPIDLQEQKGKAIAEKYRNEYRNGFQKLKNSSKNGKINSEELSDKDLYRARKINTIEDLSSISQSKILDMKSYEEISTYFKDKYNITLEKLSKRSILELKATLAGVDDLLTEFPEAVRSVKVIRYVPQLGKYGAWNKTGLIKIGKDGLKDYGTGYHEASHALAYARRFESDGLSYASDVVEMAKKKFGYNANNKKEWEKILDKIVGSIDDIDDPDEIFAFSMETARAGASYDFSDEIYRIVKEGLNEKNISK